MKKIILMIAVVAMAGLFFTGCKKDDKMSAAEVAAFLTSGDWQGYMNGFKRNHNNWEKYNEDPQSYVVMCFKGTGNSGNGYHIEFRDEFHLTEPTDLNEFNWRITDERIEIFYKNTEWDNVFCVFNDGEINANIFRGENITVSEKYKYVFDFTKKPFSDWQKYFPYYK